MFLCCCFSLLLPLLLLRCAAADCGAAFRPGPEDFVLDSEDAVMDGAVLLDSAQVPSGDACQRACCGLARCNLALLEPRGAAGAQNHTCFLFNCIHRNRFVCRFVNQDGYRSFMRKSVFLKHLQGPDGDGESCQPVSTPPGSRPSTPLPIRGRWGSSSKCGCWCPAATFCDVTVWVVRSGDRTPQLEFQGPQKAIWVGAELGPTPPRFEEEVNISRWTEQRDKLLKKPLKVILDHEDLLKIYSCSM